MAVGEAGRFRPGLALTLVAGAAFVLLLALGAWQLQRLQWKQELNARIEAQLAAPPLMLEGTPTDPAPLDFRRVTAGGELLASRSFAYGLEGVAGQPGAHLITPLRLPDGGLILLDRGFFSDSELPALLSPSAPERIHVDGVALDLDRMRAGWFTPDNDVAGRRWYRLDPDALADWLGERPAPVLLVAEHAEPPSLLGRVRLPPAALPSPHLGYALTWFGLAVALLVIYLLYGLSRGRAPQQD